MPLTNQAAKSKDLRSGKGELQHRHFATIATCLRNMGAKRKEVERWADELAPTNNNFNRQRFITACLD